VPPTGDLALTNEPVGNISYSNHNTQHFFSLTTPASTLNLVGPGFVQAFNILVNAIRFMNFVNLVNVAIK
jgi:hypothetical protein